MEKAAFKSADAMVAYCENSTPQTRATVRSQLKEAFESKDMALGLRCPGDDKMFVTGDPKEVVTD